MKKPHLIVLMLTLSCYGQEITPRDPISAINQAFETHQLVLLGGPDGSVQQEQLVRTLLLSPQFSEAVSNITNPCNSLYQPLVDRYLAGENISVEQLQPVWRNSLAIGPVADERAEEWFTTVREVNQHLFVGRHKLRVVCTDGPVSWENVHSRADLDPFVPTRDQVFISIVKKEILAKHQKALLCMGSLHFRRTDGKPSLIEQSLQEAGATTYVVLSGSNVVGSYEDRDPRFLQWKWPWMLPVQGTWLAQLPAKPLLLGGNASHAHVDGALAGTADAFLFLGPPDELTEYVPKRSALEGTPYGRETERRLRIIFGEGRKLPKFLPKDDSGIMPQYLPPPNQGQQSSR
jgi:hypothetical protein